MVVVAGLNLAQRGQAIHRGTRLATVEQAPENNGENRFQSQLGMPRTQVLSKNSSAFFDGRKERGVFFMSAFKISFTARSKT